MVDEELKQKIIVQLFPQEEVSDEDDDRSYLNEYTADVFENTEINQKEQHVLTGDSHSHHSR